MEEEGKVNVNRRKFYYLVSSFFFEWSEWNWWIFHELLSIWLVCDSKKKAEIIHISCEYLCLLKKKKRRSRLILLFSSIISVSVVGQVILCVWTNASFSRYNVEWYGVFFLHYLYDNNFLFVRRPMWRNENVFWERNENSSISLILVAWFANYKITFRYSCNGGFE